MVPYWMTVIGFLGLLYAFRTYNLVSMAPAGNARMQQISSAIREGALVFLRRELAYLVILAAVLFLVLWAGFGFDTAISYALGAFCSMAAGFAGLRAAGLAGVRTSHAASENNAPGALMVAFNGGAVIGLCIASLGLLGLGILYLFFRTPGAVSAIVGFALGASSVALFARIGGGIFTKSADVGSGIAGRAESGVSIGDLRNPGSITENVGSSVGDVAGMGADIFESYAGSLIAGMIIASSMAMSDPTDRLGLMAVPFVLGILGLLSSVLGVLAMEHLKDSPPAIALRNSSLVSTALFLALSLLFVPVSAIGFWHWIAIFSGSVCGMAVGLSADYYTSRRPVEGLAESSRAGAAIAVLGGLSVGFMSCIIPLCTIALTILISSWCGGFYAVALAAVAMLATVGITMSIEAYGPIARNAGGISELSMLGDGTRAITDRLYSAGRSTSAMGRVFATGAAALTAFALFGAYTQVIFSSGMPVDFAITNPMLLIGLLVGACVPYFVAGWTMTAVRRGAGQMAREIDRQFREIPGLLKGEDGVRPDVTRCVEISTTAALNEMRIPGAAAAVVPVLVGVVLGVEALAGAVLGATVVGVVVAFFMANSGGAWGSARKRIEQGQVEGEKQGGAAHEASMVGDTIGNPFMDSCGPAMNIVIKLMSIVALLIAPLLV